MDENNKKKKINLGLLFDTSTDNIGLHVKNICSEGELSESSITEDFSVVEREGNREVSIQDRLFESDFDKYIKGIKAVTE